MMITHDPAWWLVVGILTGAGVMTIFIWREIVNAFIQENATLPKLGSVHLYDKWDKHIRSERITPKAMSEITAIIDADRELLLPPKPAGQE